MFTKTTRCQTHAHKGSQRSGFEEASIGRLHAEQHTHGFRNKEFADGREQPTFLMHLTNTNGYQGRNGITHHRQVEEAEEALRECGQFEWEGRYLLPIGDHPSQGTHHENGYRERKVTSIIPEDTLNKRLLIIASKHVGEVLSGL